MNALRPTNPARRQAGVAHQLSPTAQPVNPEAAITAGEELLQDGELVILSIKPSLWYVVQVSWPVLLVAGLVAGGLVVAGKLGMAAADGMLMYWVCAGISAVRLTAAMGQWTAMRYVLTSRRILCVSAGAAGVTELPLTCVYSAVVARPALQRAMGIGSLSFAGESGRALPMNWLAVSEPDSVCQAVNEAIAKAHR